MINALDRDEVRHLLIQMLPESPSDDLVDMIYRHTQGVPLYIEELVRTMPDNRLIQSHESGMALIAGSDVPIPPSIRDTIILRLDGLSDAARPLTTAIQEFMESNGETVGEARVIRIMPRAVTGPA